MTQLQKLRQMLNGRPGFKNTFGSDILKFAKYNNLVIVYVGKDDKIKFEGAIQDKTDSCDGDILYFDKEGFVFNDCPQGIDCPYFKDILDLRLNYKKDLFQITVHHPMLRRWVFSKWSFSTEIPHLKFDTYKSGEIFCEGIIFDLNNLTNK